MLALRSTLRTSPGRFPGWRPGYCPDSGHRTPSVCLYPCVEWSSSVSWGRKVEHGGGTGTACERCWIESGMAHTPRADVVLPSKQSFYTTCQQDTWWRASFCKMMCPVFNNYSIAFFRLCTSRTLIKNVVQVCLLQLLHHITINHIWDYLFLLPAVIDFTSPISCSYLVQNKQHMALGTGQCQVFGHPPECWYTVVCPWPTECVSCQFTDGTSNIFITQRVSTLHQTLQRQNKLL